MRPCVVIKQLMMCSVVATCQACWRLSTCPGRCSHVMWAILRAQCCQWHTAAGTQRGVHATLRAPSL